MKILAVADEESKYLWEYYEPSKLRDIDLIIGCGGPEPALYELFVRCSAGSGALCTRQP